jgi:hypothetical protein
MPNGEAMRRAQDVIRNIGSRVTNATAKKPILPGIFHCRIHFSYARTNMAIFNSSFATRNSALKARNSLAA